MYISNCSRCGMALDQANGIKCRHCGHSSLNPSLLKKPKTSTEPEDAFRNELSPESIFSKFAVVSFFSFLISLGVRDMHTLTIVSLAGFIMFSVFYGFFRVRNS